MTRTDQGDPFAEERARALAAEPPLPRGMRGLAEDASLAAFVAAIREVVRAEVAESDDAELFDAVGVDPFARAIGKAHLRELVVPRAVAATIDPLAPAQLKRLRGRLADAIGLPANPLIGRTDPVAMRADLVDALTRIVASDIDARFPAR